MTWCLRCGGGYGLGLISEHVCNPRAIARDELRATRAKETPVSTQRAAQELQKTAEYLNAKAARRSGEAADVLRQAAEQVAARAAAIAAEPTEERYQMEPQR